MPMGVCKMAVKCCPLRVCGVWPESQGVLIVHLSHSAHLLQLQLAKLSPALPPVFSDSPGA